ncbi:Protein farnesyltransferase subunit beta [Balamuthia mandrillaris]
MKRASGQSKVKNTKKKDFFGVGSDASETGGPMDRSIDPLLTDHEGDITHTSLEQRTVERAVLNLTRTYRLHPEYRFSIKLNAEKHIKYLLKGLDQLSNSYASLDASRPWLCYWIVNSLNLLHALPENVAPRLVDFLGRCQARSGGFAGGPGQLPHLAPTYATICALMTVGTKEAYDLVDRQAMLRFLREMKLSDGGFQMHVDGESDVRGTYCAIVVASVLNILTPDLIQGTAEYIKRCQTYEGGIGGCPGNEAHGGYAYCGVSALSILNLLHTIDLNALLQWVIERQMRLEGGFQGRTNKLVDSCYSFWQAAIFPQVEAALGVGDVQQRISSSSSSSGQTDKQIEEGSKIEEINSDEEEEAIKAKMGSGMLEIMKKAEQYVQSEKENVGGWLFDQRALQDYILLCAQEEKSAGGLRDKPGKSRDYYHTCYSLNGLSIAQHNPSYYTYSSTVVGSDPSNLLNEIHPSYGVAKAQVEQALAYFAQLPSLA